jgi:1-acyl-sn-glycerol-3-phosphate acyltransferase
MKLIKEILGRLYCLYGLILFVITMLIVVIPIWICSKLPAPAGTIWLHRIFRIWMGVFMPLVFCPVRHRGWDNFKKGKNYVVVCNHNSFIDVPVSSPGIPGPNKTLAKIEMAKIPVFGLIYRAGSVLVDRKSEKSRRESMNKMIEVLNQGLHLCLYPEGTRNTTNEPLKSFHDGAFITAIQAQKPIIPSLIFGTKNILVSGKKFYAWPHKLEFHFLPEIPTEGLTIRDVTTLKQQVFEVMKAHYVQYEHLA